MNVRCHRLARTGAHGWLNRRGFALPIADWDRSIVIDLGGKVERLNMADHRPTRSSFNERDCLEHHQE